MSDEVFKMPQAEVGDAVVWFQDGDSSGGGTAGTVAVVRGDVIDIKLHTAGPGMFKMTVRHIADPKLRDNPIVRVRDGAWDHSPMLKRLMRLEDAMRKGGFFDDEKPPKGDKK